MKIKLLIIIIAIFSIQSFAQKDDWMRVQSDDGEFSIEIPKKYNLIFDKDGFEVADSNFKNHFLSKMVMLNAFSDKTLYSFEIYQAKEDALDAIYDKEKKQGKASELKIGGNKVRQIILETKEFYSARRFFSSKNFIYILTVASRDGENANMKRFLESMIFNPNIIQSVAGNGSNLSSLQAARVEVITQNVKEYKPDKNNTNQAKDPSITPMVIVNRAQPSYVDYSRQKGVQGAMRLRCVFQDDGFMSRVEFITILDGLARQVLFAALRLKFLPKEKDGIPQTAERIIEYHFSLY